MADRREMERLVRLHHEAIVTGDPRQAVGAVGRGWHNREGGDEPEACRRPGPAGLAATSAWLRFAFPDLRFVERALFVDGDSVLWWGTMTGRHDGPFVIYEGSRPRVFPATGRDFEFEQVHLHRFAQGEMVEHWAVRDDLALMKRLGYLPPTPSGIARLLGSQISGAAGRLAREASSLAAAAAAEVDRLLDERPVAAIAG